MNQSSPNHYYDVSTTSNLNQTKMEIRSLEEVHHNLGSSTNHRNIDFLKWCKENAIKSFQSKTCHSLKNIDKESK